MKTTSIILFLIMLCTTLLSQPNLDKKRDYVWVFGYDTIPPWGITIMDFKQMNSSGTPSLSYSNEHYIDLTFTYDGICDTAGNLQFYTNGIYVMNANHEILDSNAIINDCTNLFYAYYPDFGYRVIQGALILPLPGSPNQYYILHVPVETTDAGFFTQSWLYHSVVDMAMPNGAGGMGKLISKNQLVIPDTVGAGMLTACRHANGRDWWILVREIHSNRFYRCLLSPSGLSVVGTQTVGATVLDLFGQAAFSPDGSKFVIYGGYSGSDQYLHLYDFDRCTGLLSNPLTQYRHARCWTAGGVAFSPNSQYLYITQSWQCSDTVGAELMIMDVLQPNPFFTETIVARADSALDTLYNYINRTPFFWMQLGPDGKIYVLGGNGKRMGVMHNPDGGMLCDFRQHWLQLLSINGNSMPNNPHFRLGAVVGSSCDTLGIGAYVGIGSPESSFRLYPNPAANEVHLVWDNLESGQGYCTLKDALGREVLKMDMDFPSQEQTLSLKNLSSGVYYLVIYQGDTPIATEKLMITQ